MGLMGTEGLMAIRQYQQLGVKLVIDYDDLYFNCSPFNPAYRNFGLEDIEIIDPLTKEHKWLWKDGENGFSIKDNRVKFLGYQKILQEADLVTTTTVYLKEAVLEIAGGQANVSVLPNAVKLDEWKPLEGIREQYPDKFRFGWAVSGSHGEDWTFIREALLGFLKAHKDAKFVVIGDTYMDVRTGLSEVAEQIEWYPFSDLWEGHYALRMPLLGLDVAIAPLADNEFNRCKSPLKWEEYTAFGWPVIAQNMTPYKEHIENGKTGLLASDTASWINALEQLYSKPDLRKQLRFNALMEVRETFELNKVAREYSEIYKNLLYGDVKSA
jgi:glycosyltransferase involved in cell wall biosynthesis